MAIKKCIICGNEFVDYGRGKYCPGPHYKKCEVCGKEFEYDVRAQYQPKACSRSCSSKLGMKHTTYQNKICLNCRKEFYPSIGVQKFCSKQCQEEFQNIR